LRRAGGGFEMLVLHGLVVLMRINNPRHRRTRPCTLLIVLDQPFRRTLPCCAKKGAVDASQHAVPGSD
jgi:hypothetical protein